MRTRARSRILITGAHVTALTLAALSFSLATPPGALSQELLSDLPLAGRLTDEATGQTATFTRPSVAYGPDATLYPVDCPRYETVAFATRATLEVVSFDHHLVPVALLPDALVAVGDQFIYTSIDGLSFEARGVLPHPLICRQAAFGTPAGALLVALEDGHLWRSADGGQTFAAVLQFPAGCFPLHWNFTAAAGAIFVSEYGDKYQPDNPRRIYRSGDDGVTWSIVYDPPPQYGYHNHKLIADPATGHLYQAFGDLVHGVLWSPDLGETWTELHDYYQPTAAIVRPGAIYWGHDGSGAASVQRLDTVTGRWTWPLAPWRGYAGGVSASGNIFALADYVSGMYVGIAELDEHWASADGTHWAFVAGDGTGTGGAYDLVGHFGGLLHGRATNTLDYLRITPPTVANTTGLRLEPASENLLDNDQTSSFEQGLEGCDVTPPAVVTQDTTRSYHGAASVCWQIPAGTVSMVLKLPPLAAELPIGTCLRGQVRVTGDELRLLACLYDEVNGVHGPYTQVSARDEWGLVRTEMTITQPGNRMRLMLVATAALRDLTIWLDGYQLLAQPRGSSWQLGGTPRAAEVLTLPVAFTPAWTDLFFFTPDFSSCDATATPLVLKSWEQDPAHYAQLVFDPTASCFKLLEWAAGNPSVLCATPLATFWPGWTCRFAVRTDSRGSDFRVLIGTKMLNAAGPPLSIQPNTMWLASSPTGDAGVPGVYALSRVFSGRLPDAALTHLLNSLPGTAPPPADCNENGVDDAVDIAEGTSQDQDWDGVPDECEPDCNGNGQPDDLDIAGGEPDCNGNGQPDICDVTQGASQDLNINGVPDECEPDCNQNGIPDDLDILNGTSLDIDANGIPDECTRRPGDLNCDSAVDFRDINAFVLRLCNPAGYAAAFPHCPDANGDINANGAVGFDDINPFVALLTGGRPITPPGH